MPNNRNYTLADPREEYYHDTYPAQQQESPGLESQMRPQPDTGETSYRGHGRLLGRKALAKVSSQPGKTANVNFFEADGISFVDLPGYGYARVSMAERQRWANLISGYFAQERSFNLVIALVDVRLEAQKLDQDMLAFLRENDLPFVVALTKADKLSRPKQTRQVELLSRQLEVPREQMLLTSAQTGLGIDELRHRIEKACD